MSTLFMSIDLFEYVYNVIECMLDIKKIRTFNQELGKGDAWDKYNWWFK